VSHYVSQIQGLVHDRLGTVEGYHRLWGGRQEPVAFPFCSLAGKSGKRAHGLHCGALPLVALPTRIQRILGCRKDISANIASGDESLTRVMYVGALPVLVRRG